MANLSPETPKDHSQQIVQEDLSAPSCSTVSQNSTLEKFHQSLHGKDSEISLLHPEHDHLQYRLPRSEEDLEPFRRSQCTNLYVAHGTRLDHLGLVPVPHNDYLSAPHQAYVLPQSMLHNVDKLQDKEQSAPEEQARLDCTDQHGRGQDLLEVHDHLCGSLQDLTSNQDLPLYSCAFQDQQPTPRLSVHSKCQAVEKVPEGSRETVCNYQRLVQQTDKSKIFSANLESDTLSNVKWDSELCGLHDTVSLVRTKDPEQTQRFNVDLTGRPLVAACVEQSLHLKQGRVIQQVSDQPPSNPARAVQDPATSSAGVDEASERAGSVPALVITQAADEGPVEAHTEHPGPAEPPAAEPERPERPTELTLPATVATTADPSPSPSPSEGGDMACADLMSLKSDTLSLASEAAVSRRSDWEDDTRSVAASSVTSLFHRMQMDPIEKDWLRNSALGYTAALRQLLRQDPTLASKKDFITGMTALHWAAKQGILEEVDMMVLAGTDVNVRSHGGYTPLHLASIHGHQHIVHVLINVYHAKTTIRDYHGKMAVHYWNGRAEVFSKPESQSGHKLSQRRRAQKYGLPSLLLSRSRSQGQFNLDFGPVPQYQPSSPSLKEHYNGMLL